MSMRLQNIEMQVQSNAVDKLSTAHMERECDEQDVSYGVKGAVCVV
jgi:hypothetical protein